MIGKDRLIATLLGLCSLVLLGHWIWGLLTRVPDVDLPADQFENVALAQVVDPDGWFRPQPGQPAYLVARRFEFWPPLHLAAGQDYPLVLGAVDGVHSVWLAGREYLLVPGRQSLVTVRFDRDQVVDLRCNEYCGLAHTRMRGQIRVVTVPPRTDGAD